ncbi:hypothetical protein KAS45_01145, partial [candidate division WOR-3 bacterium]|nr:hypothetical protein [candidate division WOR-3 bacterium]
MISIGEARRTLKFITQLTQSVGDEIAKKSSQRKRISFKGEIDLVTQFDREAQQMIVDALGRKYSQYGILSEEDVNRDTG